MESTLALTVSELEGAIGDYLGFGRGAANGENTWNDRQQAMINAGRRSGLRSFYTASAGQEDGTQGYQWSFLQPVTTLRLESGATTVRLPEDYHGLQGQITVTTDSQGYRPVSVVGVGLVQQQYAETPDLTGWPRLAAIVPLKQQSGIKGQRFELYLFPTADQAYTLQLTYFISCNDIDAARPYPYGGAQHAETLIAACLAAAEQRQDDTAGVQTQRFQALLAGSIAVDRRNKPQLTGYCGDGSDCREWDRRTEIYQGEVVTFNGVQY